MDSRKYMVLVTAFLGAHILFLWLMTLLLLTLILKEDFLFTYKIDVCFSEVLCNRTI